MTLLSSSSILRQTFILFYFSNNLSVMAEDSFSWTETCPWSYIQGFQNKVSHSLNKGWNQLICSFLNILGPTKILLVKLFLECNQMGHLGQPHRGIHLHFWDPGVLQGQTFPGWCLPKRHQGKPELNWSAPGLPFQSFEWASLGKKGELCI